MARKKPLLAIYDPDQAYAEHLAFFLNDQSSFAYEALPFSDILLLSSWLETSDDVRVLAASSFETQQPGLMEKLQTPESLSDNRPRFVKLTEDPEEEGIFRYQSCEDLMRQISDAFGVRSAPAGIVPSSACIWTGVYSPVGRCGKTAFSIALGEAIASKRRTIYINLEPYSGFEHLQCMPEGMDLSDLIYWSRKKGTKAASKAADVIHTWKNLDYIRPVFAGCDLQDVPSAEWFDFLDPFLSLNGYEEAVLDIGQGMTDLYSWIARCTNLYVPVLPDVVSEAKWKQFEENISVLSPLHEKEKIIRIQVPKVRGIWEDVEFPELLLRSQIGSLARKLQQSVRGDAG